MEELIRIARWIVFEVDDGMFYLIGKYETEDDAEAEASRLNWSFGTKTRLFGVMGEE